VQYRKLGKTGVELSAIGFGCMRLPTDNNLAVPIVRRAVELGINYFETSPIYCQNRSEIQLGLALRGIRERIHISTKNRVVRKGEEGSITGVATETRLERTSRIALKNPLETRYRKSRLLPTARLSLDKLPVAEAKDGPLEALSEAKEKGLVDHIGFTSHETPVNLIKILDTGKFESMTIYHNLLQTRGKIENPLPAIEHARRLGIGVIVMGPLGGGILGNPIEKLDGLVPDARSQVSWHSDTYSQSRE